MTRNVIDDGFTRPGKIAPVHDLHDGLEFKFRPMLPRTYEETEDLLEKAKPDKKIALIGKALADHLVDWSEVDGNDKPRPIDRDACERLQPALQRRLYWIVSGREAGDMPENANADEVDDYLAASSEPPVVAIEASEGN